MRDELPEMDDEFNKFSRSHRSTGRSCADLEKACLYWCQGDTDSEDDTWSFQLDMERKAMQSVPAAGDGVD